MRNLIRVAAAIAGLGLLAAPASAEWAGWIADGVVQLDYDDNINRSAFSEDEEDAFVWRPSISLGRGYHLNDALTISMTADVEGRATDEFDLLNAARMGATLSLNYKFGLGADVPWMRVHGFGGYLSVQDSERSSILGETGVEFGKNFGDRFDASVFYQFLYRDGKNGSPVAWRTNPDTNVWDQTRHEVGARAGFLVIEKLLLNAHYTYRDGDFDSNASVANSRSTVFRRETDNIRAAAKDNVFGGWVYRVGGHQHEVGAGLNYLISDRWSADLGYRYVMGKARELNYNANIASLSVLFRY
jgi:hypothetical protein